MKEKKKMINREIFAIRLHLELKDENLSDYQERMLKRYGESSTGNCISRDILIPSDMPLHNLHYTIQKLFGWTNSHLRSFELPKENFSKLTNETVKGWSDLVGLLFQPPSEAEEDIFWDDDYQRGSINTWLKKKYTGPYVYGGYFEDYDAAKEDINQLLSHFKEIEVRESFSEYLKRSDKEETGVKVLKKAALIDLTLEEMHDSILIEGGTESLLERLEVDKVIANEDEKIGSKELFPVTKELIYNYDFGDDWLITITKHKDCQDLLKDNVIDEYELDQAKATVVNKHKPVCINKDGISLLDDTGGLGGFAELLGIIYEGEDKEESKNALAWARSMGWNPKKIANKNIL